MVWMFWGITGWLGVDSFCTGSAARPGRRALVLCGLVVLATAGATPGTAQEAASPATRPVSLGVLLALHYNVVAFRVVLSNVFMALMSLAIGE